MTKRDFYNAVINMTSDEEIKAFAQDELEKMNQANQKAAARKSKKQKENEPLNKAIVEYITQKGSFVTATEISHIITEITSVQKASSLLRALAKDEVLMSADVKVKGKGKQKAYGLIDFEIPTTMDNAPTKEEKEEDTDQLTELFQDEEVEE